MYSIYIIINKINNKKYVGQTSRSIKERINEHFHKHGKRKNTHLKNAIKKHGKSKFIYKVLETNLSKNEADFLESYYIKHYDTMNSELGYNKTAIISNAKMSKDTKEKISNTVKLQYKTGRKSKNKKLTNTVQYKSTKKTYQHCLNLIAARILYYSKNAHHRSKEVICINDGNKFQSARKAAEYYKLGINSVARVCRGDRKSCKGLIFKFTASLMMNPQLQEATLGNVGEG